ncbi:cytochrome c biogenesis protein [Lyngbya confervoides]|uniref:Cytochrome c biogenesis protein CcsA n=1 Tax=Lyngbya confervoides BDU141951 TaxID=1574623 RepID=A0ABD4T1U4_9CYAN|nr:cytochrome c biogenesis protein CcsA [Lyngbya confervoides]MCM1982606.1 cytochrome c biogenesis protein CcsA [Lyngbya confervoides BDU141951]
MQLFHRGSIQFLLGLCLGVLVILVPVSQFQTDSLDPLRTLAVQIEGRKKPLDTVAKETLLKIHGSPDYRSATGERQDYLRTYLSLWFNTRNWNEEPIVLLHYRPLKEASGLPLTQKYFSFQDLMGNPALGSVVQQAHAQETQNKPLTRLQQEALTLEDRLQLLFESVGNPRLPIVPHPTDGKGTWAGIETATSLYSPAALAPAIAKVAILQDLLWQGNHHPPAALAPAIAQLKQTLQRLSPEVYPSAATLQREVHFNRFHPFAKAWRLYLLALGVMVASRWLSPGPLYWIALGLFTAGIGVQAYGFLLRMQIAGRPPVTNMYESVVWVGFGIAAIALVFEGLSRAKYYLLAAAPLATVCLLLADSLPAVLDPTIAPLVPVLRDNFWLSIHVPTIALSYASFALALGLGHVALGTALFTPKADQRFRRLSQFNYRVLQVGILLLTSGIILGGIWAHFSWGRFWGWDPKETWALIALLCYLVPIHGRLVGWIGNFGINLASILSFNAVLMAWYGVNFVLGTGLHSYGFGTGGSDLIIAAVVGVDLLFVLLVAARHYGWLSAWTTSELSGH